MGVVVNRIKIVGADESNLHTKITVSTETFFRKEPVRAEISALISG
jgi:hypothetical protein